MKKLLLMALAIVSFTASARQVSEAEIIKHLKYGLTSKDAIALHSKNFDISGEKLKAVQEYLNNVAENEKIMTYMAKQLVQIGFGDTSAYKDEKESTALLRKYIFAIMQGIYSRGLLKLNTEDMEMYFIHRKMMLSNLSPAACRTLYTGNPSKAYDQESKYIGKKLFKLMSASDIRRMYSNQYKAQVAALDETIPPKTLRSDERPLALRAFRQVVIDGLSKLPHKDMTRLAQAIDNPDSSPDKDVCDAAIFLHDQMLSTTGQTRNWLFRLTIEMIQ